jgi:hypothetical protein
MVALTVALVVAYNGVAKATLLVLGSAAGAQPSEKLVAAIVGCVAILLLYALAVRFGERPRSLPCARCPQTWRSASSSERQCCR